jgi:uncharacterized protein
VQGGLLATTIVGNENNKTAKIIYFLAAKLISYTILGALLGLFGSLFQFSLKFQVAMQFVVGIFMIGTALNLLEVHPVFRFFAIQPPKFLMKTVRNESKKRSSLTPAILGAFTIFIPCGTTQAMMALAIGSGSMILGAVTMFLFIIGTSPTFFILGFITTKLGEILHGYFMKFAAMAIMLLAFFNINSALTLSGSSLTVDNIFTDVKCTVLSICNSKAVNDGLEGKILETATIEFNNSGYSPDNITVKAGSKVTLNLKNINAGGCIQSFTIPKLGIQKVIRTGTTGTVEFTAPDKQTDLAFMCGMGMYRGNIKVI